MRRRHSHVAVFPALLVAFVTASPMALADERLHWLTHSVSLSGEVGAKANDWEARARAALDAQKVASNSALDVQPRTVLVAIHDQGNGPVIVTFRQEHDGFPVLGTETDVLLTRAGEAIAISGDLSSVPISEVSVTSVISAEDALQFALSDVGVPVRRSLLTSRKGEHGATRFRQKAEDGNHRSLRDAAARRAWVPRSRTLRPAYLVTLIVQPRRSLPVQGWTILVDGVDGRVLRKFDLVRSETFSYRVFADPVTPHLPLDSPRGNGMIPHPTGNPEDIIDFPHVGSSKVVLANAGIITDDHWLPQGATTTQGNHVSVYLDLAGSDGLDHVADRYAPVSSALDFDHAFDPEAGPRDEANRNAGMTHMFYVINTLHDLFYNHGFTEPAGNAQVDNYGRGGLEGDPVLGEAQDYSGLNNADMLVPPDGISPRMQMYVWYPQNESAINYITPVSESVPSPIVSALFGPQVFELTGQVVEVNDSTGISNDACEPVMDITGKVALAARGTCTYVVKVRHAIAAGASAIVIANNRGGNEAFLLNSPDGDDALDIQIPVLGIGQDAGNQMRQRLAQDEVQVRLYRNQPMLDAALDSMVIAHEWGHYMTSRLIGDALGLDNRQGLAMAEGWSDFISLLLTLEEDDRLRTGNDNFRGTYAMSPYLSHQYFGIRRAPYSTSFAKNPLTFRHIEREVPLPEGIAFQDFGFAIDNAAPHASGEIWALALWEVYIALLNDSRYTFNQARDRMLDYLVMALKITPTSPTFLEARDAMLVVALATDEADYRLVWQAFARRGMGMGAIAPSRFDDKNADVVESFISDAANLEIISEEVREGDITGLGVCDSDGVIDENEKGHYYINLKNTGTQTANDISLNLSSLPAIAWLEGNVLAVPDLAVGESMELRVPFTLTPGRSVGERVDIQRTFTSDGVGSVVFPGASTISINIHYDFERDYEDTVDTVALSTLNWLAKPDLVDGRYQWEISDAELAADAYGPSANFGSGGLWHGPDPGDSSELDVVTLKSPPITVQEGAELRVRFDHAFRFEVLVDPGTGETLYPDIGEIQVKVSGHAPKNISDIPGATVEGPGYNALWFWNDRVSGFGGELNDGFMETTTITLPDTYGGKTVEVQFVINYDFIKGEFGWLIDNIAVENAVDPPFLVAGPENGSCTQPTVTVNAGDDQFLNERETGRSQAIVTLNGTVENAAPDEDIAWLQISGPVVELDNAGTLAPSFQVPVLADDALFRFRLSITSGGVLYSDEIGIDVKNVNGAPVVVMGANRSTSERVDGKAAEIVLVAKATDEDGDVLQYAWSQIEGPSATQITGASSAELRVIVPDVREQETLVFSLTVSDGIDSDTGIVRLHVVPSGSEPEPTGGGGGGAGWLWLVLLAFVYPTSKRWKTHDAQSERGVAREKDSTAGVAGQI